MSRPNLLSRALGLLGLFGLGRCAVIGLAGASSAWVQRWLAWQGNHTAAKWLRRACRGCCSAAG